MMTTVTYAPSLEQLQIGRVRQLTDTPSTDYRRGGPSIPPTGGGDDPPRQRPDGGRGDDGKPSRLQAIAANLFVAGHVLLLVALALLQLHRSMR